MPWLAVHRQEYRAAAAIYADEGPSRPRRRQKWSASDPEPRSARASGDCAREASLYDGMYRALWAKQLLEQGKADEARRQLARVEAGTGPGPDWN